MNRRKFAHQMVAALAATATLSGCARILYPERVGNRSGVIDVVPLVVDILLFIPGLIPGIIALVVDFGSGAIYVRNGAGALDDAGLRFALAKTPNAGHEIQLLDEAGKVVARQEIDPHAASTAGVLTLPPIDAPAGERAESNDAVAIWQQQPSQSLAVTTGTRPVSVAPLTR